MKSIRKAGFTIVELLIVIVVIGILASITIVAFNGVQHRTHDTAIRTDLVTIAKTLEMQRAANDEYPKSSTELSAMKTQGENLIRPSRSSYRNVNNLLYCFGAGASYAIVSVSQSGKAFTISSLSPTPTEFTGYTGSAGTTCPNTAVSTSTTGAWGYSSATWHSWVS